MTDEARTTTEEIAADPGAGLRPGAQEDWGSPAQVIRRDYPNSTDLTICVRPRLTSAVFEEQARAVYQELRYALRTHGACPDDLVSEKIFFSDMARQMPQLRAIREEFYLSETPRGQHRPAASYVQQPPALPGRLLEVQVLARRAAPEAPWRRQQMAAPPAGATGTIIMCGGVQQVYLGNLTGGLPGDRLDFYSQALSMFESAEDSLKGAGLAFRNVVRTWIYIGEMEQHYDDLNRARTNFFLSRGIVPAPASTGIQGVSHPPDRLCGLDLIAIGGEGRLRVEPMNAPTMNEAFTYGSRFSRGMRVELEDRTLIYVSGTASIDESGTVVHVGDIERQVERMLHNIETLLARQGASLDALVSATTYLKLPQYLDAYRSVCRRRGIGERFPNTLCVADVCRPDWLCEMEAVAVLT